jgi:hypothetical protein
MLVCSILGEFQQTHKLEMYNSLFNTIVVFVFLFLLVSVLMTLSTTIVYILSQCCVDDLSNANIVYVYVYMYVLCINVDDSGYIEWPWQWNWVQRVTSHTIYIIITGSV